MREEMTLFVGHRPSDKGQCEWGVFLSSWLAGDSQAAISSSHAQRLKKKKNYVTEQVERDMWPTYTPAAKCCVHTLAPAVPGAGVVYFPFSPQHVGMGQKSDIVVSCQLHRGDNSDGVSSYLWLRCLWVSIWDTVRLHPAQQGNTLQLASDLENVHNALLGENSSI